MIDPRTLRGQLTVAYATALLVALVAFAGVTLFVVDRTQRASLDDRLTTALRAIDAILDVSKGRIVIDPTDRTQLARVAGSGTDAAVLDPSGRPIVATTDQLPGAALALARGPVGPLRMATVRSGAERIRVAVAAVPPHDGHLGVVLVWREFDDIDALDRGLALLLGLTIPVVAAFAVLAGGVVASRGLRPLDRLASVASEIEAHDLSQRLAIPPRDDELGRLCATFDRMLDRLEAAFARQRRFTGDASHELRAPLSVIRAEADLALRKARTPEEYERALRAIAVQADYLEAVTRDLLAAARAEARPSAAGSADVAAVVRDTANRLEPLARDRGVALTVTSPAEAVVPGDRGALDRAASCVVHNAIKFARSAVDVRVDAQWDAVRVVVADDGPGFSSEALAHATERFWMDDDARSSRTPPNGDGGGAGLGLSIAAAVVEACGGTLALANGPNGGAVVTIELARNPLGEAFTEE